MGKNHQHRVDNGKNGLRHVTAYSASKHGLLGLTRSLALETARHGMTVNAICPGLRRTGSRDGLGI